MHLRRCRNASLLINRLPPELLRMVFDCLRRSPSVRSSRKLSASRFASYRPLVSAMLVCHKWHEIGSQAASLWTEIDFNRQGAFAPVLLARSLGTPILLRGCLDEDSPLKTVIADHGARIQELDLWVGAKLSNQAPVLQSILAVDMPRLRILSLSSGGPDTGERATVITDSDAPTSFPALEAMLLERFLFVPTHALPQLTHLHLAWVDDVDPSSILDLLKNTPALEVFDIIQCWEFTPPPDSAPPPPRTSLVLLPRLHSVYMWSLATTTVHDLMTHVEAPNLASLRLSSIRAMSGALLSTPLIPGTLAARTVNRLAFDLGGDFATFRTAFHGKNLSLTIDIRATGAQDADASRWAFDDFPTILALSGVEEFHFQAGWWDSGAEHLLPHLAARMPNVSTLFVRHNDRDRDSEDTERLMGLARVVVALLESDSPILFPHLAHLELIVNDIPQDFCALIAPALAGRDLDGRRLRKLRVRLDDTHWFRWSIKWVHQTEPDYAETGVYDHVDSVKIGKDKRERSGAEGDDESTNTNTLGWGQWRDSVQPRQHGYWVE